MLDIPLTVRPNFVAAGWISGRRVVVERGIPVDHPAAAILAEFGGLHVRETSDVRSDVVFEYHDIALDPLLMSWQEFLKTRFVYVGHSSGGNEYFLVDHKGCWFEATKGNIGFTFIGNTFAEAIERILLTGLQELKRRRRRPMPSQFTAIGPSVRTARVPDIPLSVRPLFTAAGWTPERQVLVYRRVPPDHPAAAILAAFGSLHVGARGDVPNDIEFGWDDIESDGQLREWERLLGTNFVLVGHYARRCCHLVIDESGRYFSSNMIGWGLIFNGSTFGKAMERILLGFPPFERSERDPRLDCISAARISRPAGQAMGESVII